MDRALTDAGFGLQFADVRADGSTSGTGEKLEHSGTGAAVTAKRAAGNIRNAESEAVTENTGTVDSVVPAGNTGHAGNVVRPFPGASANGGTKKAPAQGAQHSGSRQPAQAVAVPQGQPAAAGTGQSVHTDTMPQSQGGKPTGTIQSVQAAGISQGQGGQPVGAGQPAHAAVPQGQPVPMGIGQPVHTGTISQGQTARPCSHYVPEADTASPAYRSQTACPTCSISGENVTRCRNRKAHPGFSTAGTEGTADWGQPGRYACNVPETGDAACWRRTACPGCNSTRPGSDARRK